MDKIDEKILKVLDAQPRIPVSSLARKVRISQQVADYRIKRLTTTGMITTMGTIINLKALGLEQYRIFFTFNARKEIKIRTVFDYLRQRRGIYWAARVGGRYDLLVVLFVKDFAEFDEFIDSFNSTFTGLIKDYKGCYGLDHVLYRHKFISDTEGVMKYGYNDVRVSIDVIDIRILGEMKSNCRAHLLELGASAGVSYKTIGHRIKKLEEKNVILGYRIFIRSTERAPFVVLFSFKNYSRSEEKRLLGFLGRDIGITQVVRLFGVWNLFVHVRMENLERLQEFIITVRDVFTIIDEYEIIPVFEDIAINLFPV